VNILLRIVDELFLFGSFLVSNVRQSKLFLALILLFCLVFGSVLYVQAGKAIQSLNSTKSYFINSISTIQQIFGSIENFDNLEKNINSDLKPVTELFGVSSMTKKDIARSFELIKKWIVAIEPLSKYKFTKNGLESTTSSLKIFSNDLAEFFELLPELNTETKEFLNSLWLYRVLPINNLKVILDNAWNMLEVTSKLDNNKEEILAILGHFQTQRMVVFNQSTGEARPTGGFLGSYIPIDITQGATKILGTESIYGIDEGSKSRFVAHPATWYYGYGSHQSMFHGIRNSNFWSCINTSAEVINSGFQTQENGFLINVLMLITPQLLLDFLPDNYSFVVKGKTINKSNLVDSIELNSGVQYSDGNNPKKEIDGFVGPILEDLPKIIQSQKPSEILTRLENNLKNRNLQINFQNPKIQKLWESTGLSGNNTCSDQNPKNVITPVIANISGDKRNLYTTHNYNITKQNSKIKIKYSQSTPLDISSKLIRGYNNKESFGLVGFQIPSSAKNFKISSLVSYDLPLLRKYYVLETKSIVNKEPVILPEIQQIINSGENLKDEKSQNSGFVYSNPDGSKVVGIYVDDSGNFDVDVQMELEQDWKIDFWNQKKLEFIGQPGLNQSLNINGKNIENKDQILIGSSI
jgi:hypothetical protein